VNEFDHELAFALELAQLGGAIATKQRRRGIEVSWKADGTLVTQGDMAAEGAIRARIAEEFPEHNVFGEEDGLHAAAEGTALSDAPTWIVDPIDGTSNYVAGSPVWATLVAFRAEGENAVGVVHAPDLEETYSAARGRGAHMNDHPISVVPTDTLEDAVVLCCGEAEIDEERDPFLATLARRARRDRAVGDFRGHMLVARGAAHAMIEPCPLSAWDVAALEAIVVEAGGRLTALDGSPWRPGDRCLTSAEPLHSTLTQAFVVP
jgi:histidinol-phosphatase